MYSWNDSSLINLFENKTPLIDVRAPVEFELGSIPFSANLPIMNNEQRSLVGTCYKQKGQEEAIKLGYNLIQGPIKDARIESWLHFLNQYPQAEIFCFRGGLRSSITCDWINHKVAINKKPLPGGYKRLRHFFLSWLNQAPEPSIIRLGGLTGCGKTKILSHVKSYIDLEGLANHRGSAFGEKGQQPSQITFENSVALELMRLRDKDIVVEDEGATLGKIIVPNRLFQNMRSSKLILLEVDIDKRVKNIFEDYVKDSHIDFFLNNLKKIQKKLGPTLFKSLENEMRLSFIDGMELHQHERWIKTLLTSYYDPLYRKDLRFNQNKVIFRGTEQEVLEYLSEKY